MKGLLDEVLRRGICVNCGGCVGLCPYMCFVDGRVICMDGCTCDEGLCYEVCPRVTRSVKKNYAEAIGNYRSVFRSRAHNPSVRDKGQYGATVSVLVLLALEQGLIQKAIQTSKGTVGQPSAPLRLTDPSVADPRNGGEGDGSSLARR